MIGRGTAIVCVVLLLGACAVSVSEIHYLQLSDGGASVGNGSTPRLYLESVELPDYLLRDELLRRLDAHQLDYDHSQRWAEPLDLAIQRVVARQLGARLDTTRVHRYPAARPAGAHWHIAIAFDHFEIDGSDLRVEATATVVDSGAGPPQTLRFDRRLPTPAEPPAIAASMSELLAEFAEAIAAGVIDG